MKSPNAEIATRSNREDQVFLVTTNYHYLLLLTRTVLQPLSLYLDHRDPHLLGPPLRRRDPQSYSALIFRARIVNARGSCLRISHISEREMRSPMLALREETIAIRTLQAASKYQAR